MASDGSLRHLEAGILVTAPIEDFLGLAVVAVVVKSTTRCVPLFQATVEATRALDDNQD